MTMRPLILILAAAALAACGGDGAAPAAGDGGNASATYREGVHYHRLANPVEAADNEVVEVFSYACPACAQLQPQVDAWKRERGDSAQLRYVPVEFNPAWVPFARGFHTFQELGAFGRLHRALYDAMYNQRRQVLTIQDIADVAVVAGIDRQRFLEVAQSPEVDAAMARSREYTTAVAPEVTPSLVVAGRYRLDGRQPAGVQMFDVVDWLLENRP